MIPIVNHVAVSISFEEEKKPWKGNPMFHVYLNLKGFICFTVFSYRTCTDLVLRRFVFCVLICCAQTCVGKWRNTFLFFYLSLFLCFSLTLCLNVSPPLTHSCAYLGSGAAVCRVKHKQKSCAGRPERRGYLQWKHRIITLVKVNWEMCHLIPPVWTTEDLKKCFTSSSEWEVLREVVELASYSLQACTSQLTHS